MAVQTRRRSKLSQSKTARLARWGNSLGVRIPKEGVQRLQLRDGDTVAFDFRDDAITIRLTKPRKKWTLDELLKGVTPDLCGPDLIPDRAGRELI